MSGASQAAHTSLFDGSKRSLLEIKSYTQEVVVGMSPLPAPSSSPQAPTISATARRRPRSRPKDCLPLDRLPVCRYVRLSERIQVTNVAGEHSIDADLPDWIALSGCSVVCRSALSQHRISKLTQLERL